MSVFLTRVNMMIMMMRFFLFVGIVVNVIASVALAESKPATVNSLHESAGEKSSL